MSGFHFVFLLCLEGREAGVGKHGLETFPKQAADTLITSSVKRLPFCCFLNISFPGLFWGSRELQGCFHRVFVSGDLNYLESKFYSLKRKLPSPFNIQTRLCGQQDWASCVQSAIWSRITSSAHWDLSMVVISLGTAHKKSLLCHADFQIAKIKTTKSITMCWYSMKNRGIPFLQPSP